MYIMVDIFIIAQYDSLYWKVTEFSKKKIKFNFTITTVFFFGFFFPVIYHVVLIATCTFWGDI